MKKIKIHYQTRQSNTIKKNRDALLKKSKEYYRNNREVIRERARNKYKSLTEDKNKK